MAKQLIQRTEKYKVDTEEEALEMIEDAKDSQTKEGYLLTKSSYTMKTKKKNGEIIDLHFLTVIEKTFN